MAFALVGQPPAHPATLETLRTAGAAASLGDSRAASAIVRADSMAAGQSVTGNVTISWSGDTPAAVTLAPTGLTDSPGPGGGHLSDELNVAVDDLTAGGRVFDGPLSAMAALPLPAFAPGSAHDFRFTVTLAPDAGDSYQGSAASLRFRWDATADESPGTDTSTTTQPPTTTPPTPPPPPPPPTDTRAPALALAGAASQKAAKLSLTATCDEPCTFTATTALSGAKGATKPKAALSSTGTRATIRLTFDKRSLTALKKARAAKLAVTVTATDAAGNRATAAKRLSLKG
ncbi:MAG: hypothetical protein QOF37_2308 [Thermoleophilaceae bacterium]|nr:hypothetical protein [Thermoleophilaceae bacterium]